MKSKRATATPVPGPQRWRYRNYSILERAVPFGRRFEVRSPNEELVLFCRTKRSEPKIVFYADEAESVELFRFEPTKVRQFERSYKAVDAATDAPFGQVRKRVYAPLEKSEWFLLDEEGNQVGLVTETAAKSTLLRRLIPIDRFLSKAWAIHWGQTVAGSLQPRRGVVGERVDLDLRFDTRDEIDRRLVLGTAIALRADARLPAPEKAPPSLEPGA